MLSKRLRWLYEHPVGEDVVEPSGDVFCGVTARRYSPHRISLRWLIVVVTATLVSMHAETLYDMAYWTLAVV